MKWHYKKICLTAASLFMAVSSGVNANYVDCSGFGCQLPQLPPCTSYYSGGCSFHGDLLYWKARGSNITYNAESFSGSSLSLDELVIEGKPLEIGKLTREVRVTNKNVRFHNDFGFRLGFTYDKYCSCWGFGIEYVHFHTDAHGKEPSINCGVLEQLNQEVEYVIDAKWDLYLDYLDFVAARSFCLDPCLGGKLYLGVRYARLNQKYHSDAEYFYKGDFEVVVDDGEDNGTGGGIRRRALARQSTTINNFESEECFGINERHLFNGAGPRFGIDLEWCLGCGWSIYGDAAVSFLLGFSNHDVKDDFSLFFRDQCIFQQQEGGGVQRQQTELITEEDESRLFCREECLQANRPMTDLAIGIRWMPTFCCPYRLSFQLGWEHHAFFGQKHVFYNDLQNPLRNCTSTLAVYGLTFSTNLSF